RNSSDRQFSYITDSEGKILLRPWSNRHLDEMLEKNSLETDRWLVLNAGIDNTDWVLHHVIDLQAFLEPFYKIQRFSFLIFAFLFLFFISYTVIFFHSMISPLNILIEKMQLVEGGDYSVSVPEPAEKELNHLFHSFNRMISRVNELTERQSRIDREKGLLELQALQYQINPHFIANTLNSIRLMAVVKKNENIKNMTASLMKIINDSFRGEGNKNTLRDEIAALQSYVHIMKVRFSTPLELRFSIPGNLENSLIMKMVLQPIVENSVIHGFVRKKGKGIILIKAEEQEGVLNIRICDNGCGFQMDGGTLPEKPESGAAGTLTRVGIRNVDRRIRLNYGEDFGVKMRSRQGFFTRTDIRMPLIDSRKDER
ncbi:MAG: histidine kinase, partial [Spirochaetales bacterium]|nr:histidine kinase [Spirochaetales bacterium]